MNEFKRAGVGKEEREAIHTVLCINEKIRRDIIIIGIVSVCVCVCMRLDTNTHTEHALALPMA